MKTLTLIFATILFTTLIASALVSIYENEKKAAKKLFFLSIIIPFPFVLVWIYDFDFQIETAAFLIFLSLLFLILMIIPFGRNPKHKFAVPQAMIDERDTMFSRKKLKPGSENFINYYERNPSKKAIDDSWRKEAGLLKPGSTQYNPFHFASADASFETIDALKQEVDGPVNHQKVSTNEQKITHYIKSWTKKLGALNVGITELKDYHMYSVGGRGERYGKVNERKHAYAIAFTVEMAREMLASAPTGSIVMESGQQYLESGKIAIQLAKFIRNLGYEARAHIDGNYEVVCPLVARDAGLGEIGRMGLLMTPKLGPRIRIAVVTTNLSLGIDQPLHDGSTIDFCILCKKCADSCPGQAISFGNREKIDGVLRWQINQEACFGLWCKLGTDCGRCVSVCPYSHPDNLMHNMIRAGIKNSSLFRKFALKLDDFFYGRKPAPASLSKWMDIKSLE